MHNFAAGRVCRALAAVLVSLLISPSWAQQEECQCRVNVQVARGKGKFERNNDEVATKLDIEINSGTFAERPPDPATGKITVKAFVRLHVVYDLTCTTPTGVITHENISRTLFVQVDGAKEESPLTCPGLSYPHFFTADLADLKVQAAAQLEELGVAEGCPAADVSDQRIMLKSLSLGFRVEAKIECKVFSKKLGKEINVKPVGQNPSILTGEFTMKVTGQLPGGAGDTGEGEKEVTQPTQSTPGKK